MTIVGFNFTKMLVEKHPNVQGKINISNNIAIKNVEDRDLSLGDAKQSGLKFTFEFTSTYEPKVGIIQLVGEVLYLADKQQKDDIVKEWKKGKKVPQAVMQPLLNTALTKCNIQALILSQQLNLPPPVPLPKVTASAVPKKK